MPPNQAEMMVAAMADKACRSASSPSRARGTASAAPRTSAPRWKAELYFYGRIFGFTPEAIAPVEIVNLPGDRVMG